MTDPRNPRRDLHDIVLAPVVSEKSYGLIDGNVYTFIVAPDANKIEIRQAVEAIFEVKVANVNTLVRKGKRRRNRRTGKFSSQPDQKRALVTLAPGHSIELFEGV